MTTGISIISEIRFGIAMATLFSKNITKKLNSAAIGCKLRVIPIKTMFLGSYKIHNVIIYREKPAKADIKRTALTVLAGLFLFKKPPNFRKIYQ